MIRPTSRAQLLQQQQQQQQQQNQQNRPHYNAPPASRWAARKVLTGAIAPLHAGAGTISSDFIAAGDGAGYVSVRMDSVDGQRLFSVSRLNALPRGNASGTSSVAAANNASSHGLTATAGSTSSSSLATASTATAGGGGGGDASAHAVSFCSVPRDSASSPGEVWVAWSNGKITILTESGNKVLATLPSIAPTCGAIVALVCLYCGSSSVPLAPAASISSSNAPVEGAWLFGRAQRTARSAVMVVTASGTMLCIDTRSRALLFRVPPAHSPRHTLVRCACALADDSRAIFLLATEDCLLHAIELTVSSSRHTSSPTATTTTSSRGNSPATGGRRYESPHHRGGGGGQPHCTPRVLQVISIAPPNVNVDVECTPMCMAASTPFLRDPHPTVFVGFLTGHATFCRIISTSSMTASSNLAGGSRGNNNSSSNSNSNDYMVLYNSAFAMTLAHEFTDPVVAVIPIQHGAGCITVSPTGACVFSIATVVSPSSTLSASAAIQRVGGFYPESAAVYDGEKSSFPVGGTALGSNEAVLLLSDGGLRRLLVENPEPPMSPPRPQHGGLVSAQQQHHDRGGGGGAISPAYVSPSRRQALATDDRAAPRPLSPIAAAARGGSRPVSPNRVVATTAVPASRADAISPTQQQQQQQRQHRHLPNSSSVRQNNTTVTYDDNDNNNMAELEERDFFPMEMLSPPEGERRSAASLPRPTPRRRQEDHYNNNIGTTSRGGGGAAAAAGHGYWGSPSTNRGGHGGGGGGRGGVETTETSGVGTFTSTVDHAMHLADCVQRHYVAEQLSRSQIATDSDAELGWLWHLHSSAVSSSSIFGGGGRKRRGGGAHASSFLFSSGSGGGLISAEEGGLIVDDPEIAEVVGFFSLQFAEQHHRRSLLVEEYLPSLQALWHFHAFDMRRADLLAGERRLRRRMLRDQEDEHHLLAYLMWSTSSAAQSSLLSASSAARLSSPPRRGTHSDPDDLLDDTAGGGGNSRNGAYSGAMITDFERQLGRERGKVQSLTRENEALGDTVSQLQALLREEQRRSETIKRDLDQAMADLSTTKTGTAKKERAQREHRSELQERHRQLERQLLAQREQLEQQMQEQRRIQQEQQELRNRTAIVSPERPASKSTAAAVEEKDPFLDYSSVGIQADLLLQIQSSNSVIERQQDQLREQQQQLIEGAGSNNSSTAKTTAALAQEMAALRRQLEEEQIRRADTERILEATRKRLDSVTSVAAHCDVDSREAKTAADVAEERTKLLSSEVRELRADFRAMKDRAEHAEALAAKFEAEFKQSDEQAQRAARERDFTLRTTENAVAAVEEQAAKVKSMQNALDQLRRAAKKLLTQCDIAVSVGSEPPAFASLRKFMRELQLDLGAFKRLDAMMNQPQPHHHHHDQQLQRSVSRSFSDDGSTSVGQRMGELQARSHDISDSLFNAVNPTVIVLEKSETVRVGSELRAALEAAAAALGLHGPDSAPSSVARFKR